MRVHYEAAHYPGLGSYFAIVLDDDHTRHGLTSAWTIHQCSEYARKSGFTIERSRQEDGVTQFAWYAAEEDARAEP